MVTSVKIVSRIRSFLNRNVQSRAMKTLSIKILIHVYSGIFSGRQTEGVLLIKMHDTMSKADKS